MKFEREEERAITRDILIAETQFWARKIGVAHKLKEVQVRPMKRKWASISTRGRLTLNSELLSCPTPFRRQVIVHELVHLKLGSGSHGKLFRALVRAYLST